MALDVMPGTTRILLRSNAFRETRAVYSPLIHRKSGTTLSTIEASAGSGSTVRTGPGASNVTCTPVPLSSPRSDSEKVFAKALVAA
ncbi:Uncharacterised protein [Mycobacteroides abscessus subsp. abscessus]|nr:Uncharacterised protein [Mycobacteroides abscessus subsp. abscessus]